MPSDDFTKDLIKSLNKEKGARVAYNLAVDESPTHVKRWVSTGSQMLDYICANQKGVATHVKDKECLFQLFP